MSRVDVDRRAWQRPRRRCRGDAGQSAGPEWALLLVVPLMAWGFLAWLGRLNSASQDLANTTQSAARAASLAPSATVARTAAERAVDKSTLTTPCTDRPSVKMSWEAGEAGTWEGGSVTVTLTCTVANKEQYAGAGKRVSATDSQVIDPYRTSS